MQVVSVNFSIGQAARTTATQALQDKITALSAEISRRLILDERSAHNDERVRTKYASLDSNEHGKGVREKKTFNRSRSNRPGYVRNDEEGPMR